MAPTRGIVTLGAASRAEHEEHGDEEGAPQLVEG
jgi:hypothetical protein